MLYVLSDFLNVDAIISLYVNVLFIDLSKMDLLT